MPAAKILIVEDEAIIARSIANKLQRLGYEVTDTVDTAEAAIAAIQACPPDLVLMDIVLPGAMDGITTAALIRQNWHLPVVYLTAYADPHTLERAEHTSPFGYILKPVREKDFEATLQMALKKAREEKCLLQDKTTLLQELQHRINNNLQMIMGLLGMQARRAQGISTQDALNASQRRVQVLGFVYNTLYQSEHCNTVQFDDYVQRLIAYLSHSCSEQIQFIQQVDPLTLDLEQTIPCGLILNELIVNAIAHGFPEPGQGQIWVSCHASGDRQITLAVSNDGVALPPAWTMHHPDFLGLKLVQLMTEQLQGSFSVQTSPRVSFQVTFPMQNCDPNPPLAGLSQE